mmetsp:Transcript_62877/g.109788  ORF Transcript_62877/g.109788 Transcript_62877/m.109788 type:complete len:96 (+) Transcript_62877:120-407(+)
MMFRLFVVVVQLIILLQAVSVALAVSFSADCGGFDDKFISYFGEPLWQDLRLLTSFGLGIICMHAMETFRFGNSGDESQEGTPLERKFEMYPYAL